MNNFGAVRIEARFPTGELQSEHVEIHGLIEGTRRWWYASGQLFSEAEYHHGMIDGKIRQWSERGQLTLSAEVKNGEFEGQYESWWDNGSPKEKGAYSAGKKLPGYQWFRADGSLWRKL